MLFSGGVSGVDELCLEVFRFGSQDKTVENIIRQHLVSLGIRVSLILVLVSLIFGREKRL